MKCSTYRTDIPAKQGTSYVIDGGALLHRVHWVKDMKFHDIANQYVCYMRRNYVSVSIIFDGYDDEMSIKSSEHVRCSALNGSTPNIKISEHNQNLYSKECFLLNINNKKELILVLSNSFKADSQDVFVCKGDANSKIASTALEFAKEKKWLLWLMTQLLQLCWKEDLKDIFFMSGNKCWSIKDAQCRFGDIKEHLLFIHAW